jgi:DNA adenine methylase
VPFPFEEYQALAEVMRSCKGKVILSINDHPDIRDVFAGFRMEQVAIQYSVNKNRGKASAELIIATGRCEE